MNIRKIGILHGMERSFPDAFIERINARGIEGIWAEEISLGGTAMEEPKQYAVIVDRISHEIPYYRSYLKQAALNGTRVINNPFWWSADDKYFGTVLAHKLGVAVPKTILLPNKEYVKGVTGESLHNLRFPLDWEAMLRYVGLPAIIKPAQGGGGKGVSKVHTLEELWEAYNDSGDVLMMLQECIEWEHYVRCLCIGQTNILPIKWYPPNNTIFGTYYVDHNHLSPELGDRIVRDARALNQALGYDMNTVEFAIRDGVPYAIDFTNPAPDFERVRITDHYFEIVVGWMTDLAIRLAQESEPPQASPRWWAMMGWADPSVLQKKGNGRPYAEPAPVKAQGAPAATQPQAKPHQPKGKTVPSARHAAPSKARTTSRPQAAKPQPRPQSASRPQAATPAKPQPVATAKPQAVATAKPQPVTPAKPQPVATAKPQPVTPAKPQPVAAPKPQAVTPAKPQPVAAARPQAATTGARPAVTAPAKPAATATAMRPAAAPAKSAPVTDVKGKKKPGR